jgi:WD40 repeat protein
MRTPFPALALCLFSVIACAAESDKTAPEPPRLRHLAAVSALAFAPDGKDLAAASDDGTVILWRVADGTEVRRFEGHRGRVSALAFAPDGKTLVSGSEDGPLFVWDVAGGKRLHVLEGHDEWVLGLAFSPDGKTLASCAYDRTVRLWDAATGKALRVLKGHTESVSAVAFSPDGGWPRSITRANSSSGTWRPAPRRCGCGTARGASR